MTTGTSAPLLATIGTGYRARTTPRPVVRTSGANADMGYTSATAHLALRTRNRRHEAVVPSLSRLAGDGRERDRLEPRGPCPALQERLLDEPVADSSDR